MSAGVPPADDPASRDDVVWALTEELEEAREELQRLRPIEQRARDWLGKSDAVTAMLGGTHHLSPESRSIRGAFRYALTGEWSS